MACFPSLLPSLPPPLSCSEETITDEEAVFCVKQPVEEGGEGEEEEVSKEEGGEEKRGRVPVCMEGKQKDGKKDMEKRWKTERQAGEQEEEKEEDEEEKVEGEEGEEEGEEEEEGVEEECWKPPPQVLPSGAPVQVGREEGREK